MVCNSIAGSVTNGTDGSEPLIHYERMTPLETIAGVLMVLVILFLWIPLYLFIIWPLTKLGILKKEGPIT